MSAYRTQTYFAAIQAILIIGGSLMTAVILKSMGYPDRFSHLPFSLALVRNWGFLLLAIPLAWALITIRLEQRHDRWFSRRWTFISGFALLAGLACFFLMTMARAGSSIIQVSPS